MADISKLLEQLCAERGATLTDKGNGHYQIKGALLVNYYPNSKSRTAYVAGTTGGHRRVSPEKAVSMAFSAPTLAGRIDPRKASYKRRKLNLWKSGKTHCCWCDCQMVMEPDKPNSATLEHIIPLYRGGLDNPNNMRLACKQCNEFRGNNMPELEAH